MILSIDAFKLRYDQDRIEQLASEFNASRGSTSYDSAIVTAILTDADGYVKNALSKQYSTAEMEADSGLQQVVGQLAIHALELRRPGNMNETIAQGYQDARQHVLDLQKGVAKLASVSELLPVTNTPDEPSGWNGSDYFDDEDTLT